MLKFTVKGTKIYVQSSITLSVILEKDVMCCWHLAMASLCCLCLEDLLMRLSYNTELLSQDNFLYSIPTYVEWSYMTQSFVNKSWLQFSCHNNLSDIHGNVTIVCQAMPFLTCPSVHWSAFSYQDWQRLDILSVASADNSRHWYVD